MSPDEWCRNKTGVTIGDLVLRPDGQPFIVVKLSRLNETIPFLHIKSWPTGKRTSQIGLDRFKLDNWLTAPTDGTE
jgi:hypothetical protein